MNEKIGLITDVHANLEALKAVIEDLKEKGVNKIISLGDAIGLGYAPSETIDLLMENNVINIMGNGEAYITMGPDYFPYLKDGNMERYYNAIWTTEQLNEKQKDYLKKCPSSIILEYHDKKIALCHFPLDIRYDFSGLWKYKGIHPEELLRINTPYDFERKNRNVKKNIIIADKNPLFEGKTLNNFDYVIFGHYHFEKNHEVENIKMQCLNGTGVAISDKATYYLLDYKDGEISLEKIEIPYDYKSVYDRLDNMDYPNKKVFCKYINKNI